MEVCMIVARAFQAVLMLEGTAVHRARFAPRADEKLIVTVPVAAGPAPADTIVNSTKLSVLLGALRVHVALAPAPVTVHEVGRAPIESIRGNLTPLVNVAPPVLSTAHL